MRVLLVVHQFLPEHVAGTELVTLDVARGLRERGHHVEIFAGHPVKTPLRDEERFDEYAYEGLRVHRFKHQFVPMGGQENIVELEYDNRLAAGFLRGLLAENKFDVVHFFHLGRVGAGAIDMCKDAGIKIVYTPTDFWGICPFGQLRLPDGGLCEGPDALSGNCLKHAAEMMGSVNGMQERKGGRLLKVLPEVLVGAGARAIVAGVMPERWFSDFVRAGAARAEFVRQRLNRVDVIVPPSKFMGKMLVKNGVAASRVRVMSHGVNRTHIRRKTGRGLGERLRVGYLGTLVEHKGVHVLIEAMGMVGDAAELHLHGKMREFPAYADRLEKMVGGMKNARIFFEGSYAPEEIGAILEELDVVVTPSLWYENSPLVIQAAQAAGCPVIASNAGGMAELVTQGRDGILFEMGNVRELAEAIAGLARDRTKLRALAERAPMPKSIAEHVGELEKLYAELQAK